jgi:cytochrome P450 / NADPH-cytochrome P450 reductase
LKDVSYTDFGCGDHDWAATYQRAPKMIDASMEAHGATRIYERGEGRSPKRRKGSGLQ